MKTNTSANSGFTLVEIMIVIAIIGLLAAIAIPNFVRSRATSRRTVCINNLRQIDSAKQQWALEARQSILNPPQFSDLQPYLRNVVACPTAGPNATFDACYNMGDINSKPTCKIDATHDLSF